MQKFSLSPSTFIPYDISALTIIGASPAVKHSGGYEFTVSLHPKLAVKNYAKNLQTITKLNNEFNFKSVTLNVTLNENFEFAKIDVVEKYAIKVLGINKDCTSNITTTFDYRTKANIPTL